MTSVGVRAHIIIDINIFNISRKLYLERCYLLLNSSPFILFWTFDHKIQQQTNLATCFGNLRSFYFGGRGGNRHVSCIQEKTSPVTGQRVRSFKRFGFYYNSSIIFSLSVDPILDAQHSDGQCSLHGIIKWMWFLKWAKKNRRKGKDEETSINEELRKKKGKPACWWLLFSSNQPDSIRTQNLPSIRQFNFSFIHLLFIFQLWMWIYSALIFFVSFLRCYCCSLLFCVTSIRWRR